MSLALFFAIALVPAYKRKYCACSHDFYFIPDFIAGQIIGFIIMIVQISAYIFLFVTLCLLRFPLKYKIKQELLLLNMGSILSKFLYIEITLR